MQKTSNQTHSFDNFTLDLTRGCLLRDGEEIKLRPQTFATFKFLVENSGRLVSKDELIKAVWTDWDASDNQLAKCLSEVRQALGDHSQRYLKTVPRRGYIFEAAELVNTLPESPAVFTEQLEGVRVVIDEHEEITSKAIESDRPLTVEYLLKELKRHRTVGTLLLAMFLITAAALVYKLGSRSRAIIEPVVPFQTMNISRLTNTGKVVDDAISPDGKYVVYAMVTAGQESLWMRQVAAASNVQIIPPANVDYGGMIFSTDGNYLYYNVWDKTNSPNVLYQMPVLGGPARKLVVDIDSVITFSPDKKLFAFLRGYTSKGVTALVIANADGSGERQLAARKFPDSFSVQGDAPAWSPDGKIIACPAGSADVSGPYMTVLGVRIEDGTVRPMTSRRWRQVGRMAWLKDDGGLIFTASEQESSPSQLWYLSYPGGSLHRITDDLNDYRGVSLTADSTALATVQSDVSSNIWLAPAGDPGRATQISPNKFDGVEGISGSPDGKIVYATRATGNSDIWTMNQDGRGQKQLTADAGYNSWPTVSGDGRYIVFMSDRAGGHHIWRMDRDGNNVQRLTNGGNEWYPACSPDGQWVVYAGDFSKRTLWKVSINGGSPVQLNNRISARPAISPDGKWIATNYFDDPTRILTAIYPFAGGEPVKILDSWSFFKSWTPDGRALAYVDPHNSSNITIQPIDGEPTKQATDFKDGHIFPFAWSLDGKWLALARGAVTNDVVLISNLK